MSMIVLYPIPSLALRARCERRQTLVALDVESIFRSDRSSKLTAQHHPGGIRGRHDCPDMASTTIAEVLLGAISLSVLDKSRYHSQW